MPVSRLANERPTAAELAERRAAAAEICSIREQAGVSRETSADLIHQVRAEAALIGLLVEEDGRDVVHYFADEAAADAARPHRIKPAALSVIGAWSDLDWDEMERELDRIRHESRPTPPVENP